MGNPLAAYAPALQPPSSTQPMISPSGQHGDIPVERVQDAIKAGFKPAMDMIAPDGSAGVVPLGNAHEAMQNGFKPAPAPSSAGSGQVDALGRQVPQTLPEKMANLTPAQQDRYNDGMSMAVPETLLSLGTAAGALRAAPLATAGKLLTSAGTGILGAGAGRFAARELGGGEDAQDAAGFVGGTLGGIAGYHEPPSRIGFGRFSMGVSDALRPAGAALDAQAAEGAFMNRGYKPAPSSPTPLSPNYSVSSAVRDTPFTLQPPSAEASTATSPNSVQYVASLGRGARSVTSGQTTLPPEPGVSPSGVVVIPEPNVEPGVPNNMGSVPRDQLLDLAQRLKAGAGTQLRSLGNSVIYLPRGSSR